MDISLISSAAASALPPSGTMSRTAHTPAEQRKAVAGQFEAIMLRQLLGQSLGSMMGGENSPAGSIYGYMMTDVFSQKLAQGGGLGLAGVIERQLTPRGQPAAPAADQNETEAL